MLMSVAGFILFLVCSFISLALKITNKDLNCSSDQKKKFLFFYKTLPAAISKLNIFKSLIFTCNSIFKRFRLILVEIFAVLSTELSHEFTFFLFNSFKAKFRNFVKI